MAFRRIPKPEVGRVNQLAQVVQEATGQTVELAYADQGIRLEVVKLVAARQGFVLL